MLNIKKRLITLPNAREAFELQKVFEQCYNTQSLANVAVVAGGAVATWSTTNASMTIVNGVTVSKAAIGATAVPTAAATTATGFQVVTYTIGLDVLGNVTTYTGPVITGPNAASALGSLIYPQVPDGVVVIGGVIIQTAATAFIPGTTLFNAAGVTALAYSVTGPFFPVSPL